MDDVLGKFSSSLDSCKKRSNSKILFPQATEDSSFSFSSFAERERIIGRRITSGYDLLAVNEPKRLMAVGCDEGVYMFSSWDLHTFSLVNGKKFDYRNTTPWITTTSHPLKIQFDKCGDTLGVLTENEVQFFQLELVESVDLKFRKLGRFLDFSISSSNQVGLLESSHKFLLYESVKLENLILSIEQHAEHQIQCFSFSPTEEDRLLFGTTNGSLILFDIATKEVISKFKIPCPRGSVLITSQPIRNLKWVSKNLVFFSLFILDTFHPCIMTLEIGEEVNGKIRVFKGTCKKNWSGTREMKCEYFEHWNCLVNVSSDSRYIQIFEEFSDDWKPLRVSVNSDFFREMSSCRGFVADFTFRVPLGNDRPLSPVTPALCFLRSNGELQFCRLCSNDRNLGPRGYSPLELYRSDVEKNEYYDQWRRLYNAQMESKKEKSNQSNEKQKIEAKKESKSESEKSKEDREGMKKIEEALKEFTFLEQSVFEKREELEESKKQNMQKKTEKNENNRGSVQSPFGGFKKGFLQGKEISSPEPGPEEEEEMKNLKRKKKVRICGYCGKKQSKMKKCSGCGRIRYCSSKCQKIDWKRHKSTCSKK